MPRPLNENVPAHHEPQHEPTPMRRGSGSGRTEPNRLNPLAVIVAFFSFSEVVLGSALIMKADGGLRVALVAFLIAFPTLVSAAFFVFLWWKPSHLYAPTDYKSDDAFERMLRFQRIQSAVVAEQLNDVRMIAAESAVEALEQVPAGAGGAGVREKVEQAADKAIRKVTKTTSFSVEISAFPGKRGRLDLPSAAFSTFEELTDHLYFQLYPAVSAYMYGREWVLKDRATDRVIPNMRMLRKKSFGRRVPDARTLEEAGIVPGMELEIVRPG